MASTRTITETPQNLLDNADPNLVPDLLRQVKLGTHLTPQKQTFSGLTSAAAQQVFGNNAAAIAAAAFATPGVNTNVEPPATFLPAILSVTSLRVTAGAAFAGSRIVVDSGGTPLAGDAGGPGVAVLSDDGTTLTFEAAVTGFVIEYIPRPAVNMTSVQAEF
jgi:hypothetical protein